MINFTSPKQQIISNQECMFNLDLLFTASEQKFFENQIYFLILASASTVEYDDSMIYNYRIKKLKVYPRSKLVHRILSDEY